MAKADAATKEKAKMGERRGELKGEGERAHLDVETAKHDEEDATAPSTWVYSGGTWVRVLEGQVAPETDRDDDADDDAGGAAARVAPEGALHTLAPRHLSTKFVESKDVSLSTMHLQMRVRGSPAEFGLEERCERLTTNLGTLLNVPSDVIGLRVSRGQDDAAEALATIAVLEAEIHFEDARALGVATKMLTAAHQTWISTVRPRVTGCNGM